MVLKYVFLVDLADKVNGLILTLQGKGIHVVSVMN